MTIFIETDRLILKPPTPAELDNWYSLLSNSEVMYFISETTYTLEEVREKLNEAVHHYEKHGFSFGSVYEKESGRFVGGAGLVYLGYDDSQPEIEVGYALQKTYWGKGYATEIAAGIIHWGLTNLPVKRLLGVTHPGNLRSRTVLEKVGMRFLRNGYYHGMEVVYYHIRNKNIDLNTIQIAQATLDDYPAIQNLGRFYVYDMTSYLGDEKVWECPADGLYECIDLKKYWFDENSFPFVIKVAEELAGFFIIDKKGSDETVDFNMAQFFITRKFQGRGFGRYVAFQCFDQIKGSWEVMIEVGNDGAYSFWHAIIKQYTDGQFDQYTRKIPHLETEKNIFRLNSRDRD